MASLGFNLGFAPSVVQIQQHRKVYGSGRARVFSCSSSPQASLSATAATPPEIELEFFGPKPGSDGSYPADKAKAVSGEKLLRNIMKENKIELYATYGKVMNCGGGGSCGTCIVEILDGRDLLNERTDTENKYLKKVSCFDHNNNITPKPATVTEKQSQKVKTEEWKPKPKNQIQKPNAESNTKSQRSDYKIQDKKSEAKTVKDAKAKGDSKASSIRIQNRFGVLSMMNDVTDV